MASDSTNTSSSTMAVQNDGSTVQVPVGALLRTCAKGPNKNKRYWIKPFINNVGRMDTQFIGWMDTPVPDTTTLVNKLLDRVRSLEELVINESIQDLKSKSKKL